MKSSKTLIIGLIIGFTILFLCLTSGALLYYFFVFVPKQELEAEKIRIEEQRYQDEKVKQEKEEIEAEEELQQEQYYQERYDDCVASGMQEIVKINPNASIQEFNQARPIIEDQCKAEPYSF